MNRIYLSNFAGCTLLDTQLSYIFTKDYAYRCIVARQIGHLKVVGGRAGSLEVSRAGLSLWDIWMTRLCTDWISIYTVNSKFQQETGVVILETSPNAPKNDKGKPEDELCTGDNPSPTLLRQEWLQLKNGMPKVRAGTAGPRGLQGRIGKFGQ